MDLQITNTYKKLGVENFYKNHPEQYMNPHLDKIKELFGKLNPARFKNKAVLDLACGNGEITELLPSSTIVEGADPYMYKVYKNKTGKHCRAQSFEDIAKSGLRKNYDCVICSFALHLAKPSQLPIICQQLALRSHELIILTPHKRPVIKTDFGWNSVKEIKENRIRLRIYKSNLYMQSPQQ